VFFEDFIVIFGTHYISSGIFGAMCNMYIAVSKDFTTQYSSKEISLEANFLLDYLKGGGGVEKSTSTAQKEFRQCATVTTSIKGLMVFPFPQKITTPFILDFSFKLLDEISNRYLYLAMKTVRDKIGCNQKHEFLEPPVYCRTGISGKPIY
jgi:hypothetical protein